MAVVKEHTVIDLDGRAVTVVAVAASPQRVTARRWALLQVPQDVSIENPGMLGAWIGKELAQRRISRSRVILTVPRSTVVLKPLVLPSGDLSAPDIANIVRLQMNKQLATHGTGAAIDYVPFGASTSGAPLGVLAGALPASGLTLLRGVAAAASCKLTSIALRGEGAAALLAELSQRRGGSVLAVLMGAASIEVLVVDDGQLVFARSLDSVTLPREDVVDDSNLVEDSNITKVSGDIEDLAERIAVEVKRTWAGYVSIRGDAKPASGVPELLALIAPPDYAKAVGEKCSVMLGNISWDLVVPPSFVEIPESLSDRERSVLLPLLGAAAQHLYRRPQLNFARERKLPDPREKRRTLALAGVLGAIVLGGIGYIAADQGLNKYRTELSEATAREQELSQDLREYQVRHAKVSHAFAWQSARVDWLGHIQRITDQLPAPTEGVADELAARSVSATIYKPGKQRSEYLQGTWEQPTQVLVDISGRVRSRQVASDMRERILSGETYNVESQGPDTPDRYSFSLVTAKISPLTQPAVEPPIVQVQRKKSPAAGSKKTGTGSSGQSASKPSESGAPTDGTDAPVETKKEGT